MKPSGILNFENVPLDAGDPDVKVYVNGELVETGGGSSDLTLATITIAEDSDTEYLSAMAYVDGDAIKTMAAMECSAGDTFTVPLYKGTFVLQGPTSNLTVTGDAEITSMEGYLGNVVVITGDCTLKYEAGA